MAQSFLGPTSTPLVAMYGDLVPLVATANFYLNSTTGLWTAGAGNATAAFVNQIDVNVAGNTRVLSGNVDALTASVFGPIANSLNYGFNGTTYDRLRTNVDTAALQTLTTAAAGTTNSTDQVNYNGRGLQVGVNITAVSGGQTLTVNIQGKDAASATYYTLLASAALGSVAFTQLTVYPGGLTTANVATPQPLPRVWRVQAVVAGAGTTVTATIGASVIL